ncbi:hypothetical protein SVIOM342S_03868 [Streptomyces violaceorubidus]
MRIGAEKYMTDQPTAMPRKARAPPTARDVSRFFSWLVCATPAGT